MKINFSAGPKQVSLSEAAEGKTDERKSEERRDEEEKALRVNMIKSQCLIIISWPS